MTTDYSSNNNAVNDAINNSYLKPRHSSNVGAGYQFSAGMTYQVPKTWAPTATISDAKTCYVIATWSGKRRAGNNAFHKNPLFYLKKHFAKLSEIEHLLDLIVLAIPHNITEPPAFTSYISSLPSEIKGVPLKILRRENVGQSYGSWSDAFNIYPEYDYYIFIEDDYAPVIDNFDELMIQMFEASPDCGYLCSYAHNKPPEGAHAAISNGISSNKVLTAIKHALSIIPYGGSITKIRNYASEPQLDFSRGFIKVHLRIYDYLSHYSAPFNEAGELKMYGDSKPSALLYPIQFLK